MDDPSVDLDSEAKREARGGEQVNAFNKGIIDDILVLENGDFEIALGKIEDKEVRDILKNWRRSLTGTKSLREAYADLSTVNILRGKHEDQEDRTR